MDSNLLNQATSALRFAGCVLAGAFLAVLVGLRYVAFYLLMWLRMIVVPVTHACAFLALIGLALAALMFPDKLLLWRLGLFGFGAFVLGWLYDGLLLVLSPQPLILTNGNTER